MRYGLVVQHVAVIVRPSLLLIYHLCGYLCPMITVSDVFSTCCCLSIFRDHWHKLMPKHFILRKVQNVLGVLWWKNFKFIHFKDIHTSLAKHFFYGSSCHNLLSYFYPFDNGHIRLHTLNVREKLSTPVLSWFFTFQLSAGSTILVFTLQHRGRKLSTC